MYRYVWNALEDRFDLIVNSIEFAEKLADTFLCEASAAVGDLVIASSTTEDKVEVVSSNIYDDLIFGVIISKPSSTTAEVLVSGRLDGFFTGLTFGKSLFVSEVGGITTSKPATGHIQIIGRAIKSDSIFLLPSNEKVIQS